MTENSENRNITKASSQTPNPATASSSEELMPKKELVAQYYTLGCKLNYSETSTIEEMLMGKGIRPAARGEEPDLVIVNTCSVTSEAGKKSIRAIKARHKKFPAASIIVTGCHAQLNPEEMAALEGVKILVGNDRKHLIAKYIEDNFLNAEKSGASEEAAKDSSATEAEKTSDGDSCSGRIDAIPGKDFRRFESSCSRGERTRFFLKVQDGCDYWCSYCTIPRARGRSRSPHISELVEQAREAARRGGREIVLTGVNIGDFGKPYGESFYDLVRALDEVEGIARYRISSIEPNLLTEEIIAYCAESRKFMPHFHVPLQSGSDEVLRLMRRHYDTAAFREKMELIVKYMPDAFIGIDLIVGARGETLPLFEESKQFIASLPISRLHVFTYSERADTAALAIRPIVSQEEKHRRTAEMIALSHEMLGRYFKRFEGTVRPVLVEHPCSDRPLGGFTDNYLRVNILDKLSRQEKAELDNKIVNVRLGKGDPVAETIEGNIVI